MVSSTSAAFDMTLNASASSNYTLTVMTVVAVLLVPVVLVYQAWTYWVFRQRVSAEDFGDGARRPLDLLDKVEDGRRSRWRAASQQDPEARSRARETQRRLTRTSRRGAGAPGRRPSALGLLATALIVAQATLLAHVIAGAFLGGASLAELAPQLIWLAAISVARGLVDAGFEATRADRRRAGDGRAALAAGPPPAAGPARGAAGASAPASWPTAAVQGVDALEAYFARYLPQVVLAALAPLVHPRLDAARATGRRRRSSPSRRR